MASQMGTDEFVVSLMRSAKVTDNEAMAFMGTALGRMEMEKPGRAVVFIKELIQLRATRRQPDLSQYIR